MRSITILLLLVVLFPFSGCESRQTSRPETAQRGQSSYDSSSTVNQPEAKLEKRTANPAQAPIAEKVSLNQADAAKTASEAIERKIIRNANLTVEVTSPTESQRKIVSIAESHQGFVVTSEATHRTTEDKTK